MFSQLPIPAPGSIENFLAPAAAVVAMFLLFRKAFARRTPPADSPFVTKVELNQELNAVRDKITEKIEILGNSLHNRLTALESAVARLDERTKS